MTALDLLTHLPVRLLPDPSRVVIRPFIPADDQAPFVSPNQSRAQRITERVLGLDKADVQRGLTHFTRSLEKHHRDVPQVLLRRFHEVNGLVIDPGSIDAEQSLLVGAYFSEEYSFEAGALFNPSIVPHPDQTGIAPGDIRLLLSLRGIGEGNISSVTFRTGLWSSAGALTIDQPSVQAISAHQGHSGRGGG